MEAFVEELCSGIRLQNEKLFEVLEYQYGLTNNKYNYQLDEPVTYSLPSELFVLIIHDQINLATASSSNSFVSININHLSINSPLSHFKLINKRKHEIYEPTMKTFLQSCLNNIVKIHVLDNKTCRNFVENNCTKMTCPVLFLNNPFIISYKRAAPQQDCQIVKQPKLCLEVKL